ncbi:MAG: hypothetical protein M1541_19865, partial [Acidobacteria bacterium]|nr:hypothetical protein [Acidobacteriota bacterium]
MPIDPSVALQTRVPQMPDATEVYGRAAALKNLLQRNEMQGLQLQQAQQELQEQQRLRQAYMESGGDIAKTKTRAMQLGVGPKTLQTLDQQILGVREKLANIDAKELEVKKAHTEAIGSAAQAVLQLPPEMRAQGYSQARANLIAQGRITAEEAPEQYPGDEAMQVHANSARTSQQIIDSLLRERQVSADEKRTGLAEQRFQAELPGIQAGVVLKGVEAAGQMVPSNQADWDKWRAGLQPAVQARVPAMYSPTAAADVERMAMTPEQRAGLKLREKATEQGDERIRQGAERIRQGDERLKQGSQRIAITGAMMSGPGPQEEATGEAYLADLSKKAPGMAGQVKAIAEGRATMPSGSRGGAALQLRNAVFQYDPGFNEQRAQVRKAFTTGKVADNIGALNTAIVHAGQLGDVAQALNNGTLTPGNEIYNWAKSKFGDPAVTNFELLKSAVAGEMANALKGQATDVEIHNIAQVIKASGSPAQLRGAVVEGMKVLRAKANTYDERYHQEMPDDKWSPILPSAKRTLEQ